MNLATGDSYRGGLGGASVLYHLAKCGWSDVALVERAELTAGSTWHAAAGFHALNADPNIAALQDYTIKLYKSLEEETGRSVGLHMTVGYLLERLSAGNGSNRRGRSSRPWASRPPVLSPPMRSRR